MFHLAGSDYLRWFVEHGTLIALGFVLVSVAVDLNRHTGLIATSAARFVATLLEGGQWRTAGSKNQIGEALDRGATARRG